MAEEEGRAVLWLWRRVECMAGKVVAIVDDWVME